MAQGMDIVRHTVLVLHTGQITVTTVGAIIAAPPNHGGQLSVDIAAVGGDANETYQVNVQGRNFLDPFEDALVDDLGDDIAAPGLAPATQPNGAQVFTGRVRPFRSYQVTITLAGTTPDVTPSVLLTLVDSTRPPALPQDPT